MTTLKAAIESLVAQQLSDVQVGKVRTKKVIRDALTGTIILDEYEVNIIDLLTVQRLRRIHQTGLAFLTYPCTTHNRFQHTLGVINIVTKLATSLKGKVEYKDLMDEKTISELRLAAILHDVGHGPFSHPSEEILVHFPEVKSELLTNPKFSKVMSKPHEMLSYLVITSDAFRRIIDQLNSIHAKNIDIDRVANMIVGDMDDPKRESYVSDLINGPFDADKLDYMPRDAYFSGLKMEIDLDRIAYTTLVDLRGSNYFRRLCCDVAGVHNLEQILFNKVLLYSSIYHHHKVRALFCMLKSIFEIIWDNSLEIDNHSFRCAADFLSIDDYDIFSRFDRESTLTTVIINLKKRQVLKRALVISRHTVKNPMHYQKLTKFAEKPDALRELRALIVDEVSRKGGKCSVYDLWVDLPEPPSLREPSQCLVKVTDKDYTTLDKIFPADWWLTAYGETKWRGHIFCPPQTNLRQLVNEASQKVLKEVLGIEFEKAATIEAKIPGLY